MKQVSCCNPLVLVESGCDEEQVGGLVDGEYTGGQGGVEISVSIMWKI